MLRKSLFFLYVALLSLGPSLIAASIYLLRDDYVGSDFFDAFEYQAIDDPTHGRVEYVNLTTALANNLTYATWDSFVIRADDTHVLDEDGPGRMSVRIRSFKNYTTHVIVLDVNHMPQGCATWPAAWETMEADWPDEGEVDIIEGVNDVEPNKSTLHTNSGCTMPANRTQLGTSSQDDCDWNVNYNAGCGVYSNKSDSYGPSFNEAGGGWYAMERTNEHIRVFFWSRNDCTVPSDVANGNESVNPDKWGTPVAYFPNTTCDFTEYFGNNNIIINLTLCGDWAGNDNVYSSAGCPGTCVDYVNNNPSNFSKAYWDIAAVRVYEPHIWRSNISSEGK